MTTKLSKLQGIEERENMNCSNQVAENGREKKKELWLPKSREEFKKKMLRPQYFYNKSKVISCYQFKFEFNTEITFLIQQ